MTKINQTEPVDVGSSDYDVDSMMDTIRTHSREFTIGAVVVVVLAAGGLLWRQSSLQKDARAEKALGAATMEFQAGNRPLARADLGKAAERYLDTRAGVEASMIAAQIDFEDKNFADGIKILEAAKKSSLIKEFAGPVDGLIGGALADQKKYDEAAKRYLAAADESEYKAVKDTYQADAARVLAFAGKKDDARKIWESIASRPDSPMIGEAKVRLGELEASPAKN